MRFQRFLKHLLRPFVPLFIIAASALALVALLTLLPSQMLNTVGFYLTLTMLVLGGTLVLILFTHLLVNHIRNAWKDSYTHD